MRRMKNNAPQQAIQTLANKLALSIWRYDYCFALILGHGHLLGKQQMACVISLNF